MNKERALRVIIAEDDFLVSKEISRCVKKLGYAVVSEVSTGIEVIEKTYELKPDAVLMDIQMPGMNGLEASRRIQARCPTPVVVMTAYESQDLLEKACETGVGAYLTKPPKTSELERAITISMARHADLMNCRKLYEELAARNREIENALAEIKTLKGLLPICAACKKIRDSKGYWEQIEAYLKDHSDVEFSHSICPECAQELYPEYDIY
jgi:AmiR/NasT family two-component response regulator